MKPTVKFDRTLVTVLVDEVVHVMLELTAPPAVPVERVPLNVVVVLDRSGSMSGPPIASVTAATAQLLRLAGPDDRIGVAAATLVLNEFPITDLPNGVEVALGDAYGSELRKLVAKFHLRPDIVAGPIDVATLTIRWAATTGDLALRTVTMPVVVTAGDLAESDPDADHEVTEEVCNGSDDAEHRFNRNKP